MAEQQKSNKYVPDKKDFNMYVRDKNLEVRPIKRATIDMTAFYLKLHFKYNDDGRFFEMEPNRVYVGHPSGRLERICQIHSSLPFGLRKVATVSGTDENGKDYSRRMPFNRIKEFYIMRD